MARSLASRLDRLERLAQQVLNQNRVLSICGKEPQSPRASIEYYEDGYPKLSACLDRRVKIP
jgi:hypothetical protein